MLAPALYSRKAIGITAITFAIVVILTNKSSPSLLMELNYLHQYFMPEAKAANSGLECV